MRTFGEGAPLLMLAGAGGRGAGFMPLARRWRAQYRAYMPDPCAPFAPEEAARGLLARMRRRAWSGLMCWARRWAAVRRWRWPLWRRSGCAR